MSLSEYHDNLLEYYGRELSFLRHMGRHFAESYPKIAARLELGQDECPDPHIERLLEAFAFLTGRIQSTIEDEFPRTASAFLNLLYPHLASPAPSMSVARFEVDPAKGKLSSGQTIPRKTPLFTLSEQGQACKFQTCYPVTLWPVELASAGFESTDQFDFLDKHPEIAVVLRLRISSMGGSLQELDLSTLRLYLNGERLLVNALYELLHAHVLKTALLPDNGPLVMLPQNTIQPVGFRKEEGILPYPSNVHLGYRLLHEYFVFPEKFLFFDVQGLQTRHADAHLDILFLLDQLPGSKLSIDRRNFCLGCTPVINLFEKYSEPIRLDHRQSEYRLIPDKRREKHTEIYSIRSVASISDQDLEHKPIEPYFSFQHALNKANHKAFWVASRRDTGRSDLPGSEIFLSFVDLNFNPRIPSRETVHARLLCTNRRMAEAVPPGALLQIEETAPLSRISLLRKPTRQVAAPVKGGTLWRLISHLSLNYLSLSNEAQSLSALREILMLYSSPQSDPLHMGEKIDYQHITGIRELKSRSVVKRIGTEAWRGFCRGIEITLDFDERLYVGSSAFVLASVLNAFFPNYVSVNSFTQLVITSQQRKGVWKKWPPMAGEQVLL